MTSRFFSNSAGYVQGQNKSLWEEPSETTGLASLEVCTRDHLYLSSSDLPICRERDKGWNEGIQVLTESRDVTLDFGEEFCYSHAAALPVVEAYSKYSTGDSVEYIRTHTVSAVTGWQPYCY